MLADLTLTARRRVPPATALVALGAALVGVATAQTPPPRDPAVSPAMAEMLGPWLADWIMQSRDAAIGQGVQPIPAAVRHALSGYVPEQILDRVRWRAGPASELTVQQNVFQFHHAPAVTLDYVIVFATAAGATDAKLWAHEIRHVMQFADWGVREFAVRYLANHAAVEREASEFRWEWLNATGLAPKPANAEAP